MKPSTADLAQAFHARAPAGRGVHGGGIPADRHGHGPPRAFEVPGAFDGQAVAAEIPERHHAVNYENLVDPVQGGMQIVQSEGQCRADA